MNLHNSFVSKKLLKPKILLRAMGARRDGGYCLVLKALFENYGFDVKSDIEWGKTKQVKGKVYVLKQRNKDWLEWKD